MASGAGVAQVFFQVSALAQVFRVDLRDRQAMTAKVPGELQKRRVLFAHVVQNAHGAHVSAGKAHDGTPGSAQLALEGVRLQQGQAEVLLKEPLEDVHT
jgi:hypothetical protein